jgi:hypothetical protein
MSKRKKAVPQLYDHNAVSVVHRNLGISRDGRRVVATNNLVDTPSSTQSAAPYTPNQATHDGVPYAFDDEHIPVDNRNADDVSGVKVKVSKRAKRYENSVSSLYV